MRSVDTRTLTAVKGVRARARRRATFLVTCLLALLLCPSIASAEKSPAEIRARLLAIAEMRREGLSHALVREEGLDPDSASLAFTNPQGIQVKTVSNPTVGCIMLSLPAEHCMETAGIEAGRELVIENHCGTSETQRMFMFGLAPAGTTGVRIPYSSGAGLSGDVINGAFLIESTNPEPGEPYPRKIEFLNSEKRVVASQQITGGDDLCMWKETGRPPVVTVGRSSKRGSHHSHSKSHHKKRSHAHHKA